MFVANAQDADATRALGARLARAVLDAPGSGAGAVLITLTGDLGAGKTTLVGGFLEALGHVGSARSPTYTLVEPYHLAGRDVVHCDLYRLRHPDELDDLGLREMRRPGSVLLVEWPDKAEGRLGPEDLTVRLGYAEPTGRTVSIEALSEPGRAVVAGL